MNQGSHTIDALIALAQAQVPEMPGEQNPIIEVSAYIAKRGHDPELIEVEDTATASFRLRNGALGQFLAGTSMYPEFTGVGETSMYPLEGPFVG